MAISEKGPEKTTAPINAFVISNNGMGEWGNASNVMNEIAGEKNEKNEVKGTDVKVELNEHRLMCR